MPHPIVSPAPAPAGAGPTYERRHPERGTLHAVVRENLRTLYAAVEEGFPSAPLPPFVRREIEGYLSCGLLTRGFAVLKCEGCSERRLVAFSCKGRGFCPACLGRRMAQTVANLTDHVIPSSVPLRQWVLTLPFELRTRLAYDGKLLAAAGRLFVRSVLGWYRRRMRDLGAGRGQSGAVTVVQRTSSDLKCNPHWHAVVLDGVFAAGSAAPPAGSAAPPVFHALPSLSDDDVADVLQEVRVRILGMLARRGVIDLADEPPAVLAGDLAEREPALAHLSAAAVSGRPPAGPELRRKPQRIRLPAGSGLEVRAPLCASETGFNLHAATTAAGEDARAREALLKYVLRPPVAQDRIVPGPDGLVRILLRRPFRDGTWAVDLDPLSLLSRLAAAVHPPRLHSVRYAGILAPAAKWRRQVVPDPESEVPAADVVAAVAAADAAAPAAAATAAAAAPAAAPDRLASKAPPDSAAAAVGPDRPAPRRRSCYRPWVELLRRTFAIDVATCPRCGGRMHLLAFVQSRDGIRRFLGHLGEPTDPPPLAPARAPPYFATRRHRRSPCEPAPLLEE